MSDKDALDQWMDNWTVDQWRAALRESEDRIVRLVLATNELVGRADVHRGASLRRGQSTPAPVRGRRREPPPQSARPFLRAGRGVLRRQLGTGSSQPEGIRTALLASARAELTTTLSSEPRAAAIGRGIGALGTRGARADAIVMNPTDYVELMTEGLDSYAGGWAVAPAAGASTVSLQAPLSLWGVRVFTDSIIPTSEALVGQFRSIDFYVNGQITLDVSSEAGTRFDQNLTGFRAEEDLGFVATPAIAAGLVQRVTGL